MRERTVSATEEVKLVLAIVDVGVRGVAKFEAEFATSNDCSYESSTRQLLCTFETGIEQTHIRSTR